MIFLKLEIGSWADWAGAIATFSAAVISLYIAKQKRKPLIIFSIKKSRNQYNQYILYCENYEIYPVILKAIKYDKKIIKFNGKDREVVFLDPRGTIKKELFETYTDKQETYFTFSGEKGCKTSITLQDEISGRKYRLILKCGLPVLGPAIVKQR